MHTYPLAIQHFRFTLLVVLPLIMFGYGCGDTGNINPNAPPDTAAVKPPDPTDEAGPAEDSETVIINEIFPEASQIELRNTGTAPADISRFWLCHTTPALIYSEIPDETIIEPGGFLIVNWGINGKNSGNEIFTFPAVPIPMNVSHGEIGFYTPFGFDENNFANSDLLRDYVQWGEADHFRQGVAIGANIWPEGVFVPAPPAGQSFSFSGKGNTPDSWTPTPPSIGTENNIPE